MEPGTHVGLRVFVCDDSLGFPALVQNWCEVTDGVECAGSASTQAELLRALPAAQADVLLLDYMLPDGSATWELVTESRRVSPPGLRVILISALAQDELAEQAATIGADASCPKLTGVDDLFAVVAGTESR